MSGNEVKVGFGRASLWKSWHTERPLADEIDVRAVVADSAAGRAAIAVADVCGMWPSTCLRLRRAVAAQIGTAEERVGIFCTQNHGAPMEAPDLYDLHPHCGRIPAGRIRFSCGHSRSSSRRSAAAGEPPAGGESAAMSPTP